MAAIALPTQTGLQSSSTLISDSGRRMFVGSLTLPNSYNTGGYTIAPSQFGMVDFEVLIAGTFISGGHCLTLSPVITNNRLSGFLVFDLTTGAEAAGAFNCSQAPCFPILVGN